ncbi:hypothetical protein NBRC10513v2_005321 [Rhodotorula toruloides]
MFSSSLASLVTLAVVALNANSAQAAMAQGNIDPMNDWHLRVGPLNEHHQLDCRFSTNSGALVQQGTTIWAKCGGKPKSPDGTWTNALAVVDRTRQLARTSFGKSVHIISKPVTKARCVELQKKDKNIVCDGAAAPSVTKRTTTPHKPTSTHKTTTTHKATTTHKVTTTHEPTHKPSHKTSSHKSSSHKTSSHKPTTTKKPAHPTHKQHHHEQHHVLPTKRLSGLVKKVAAKKHEKH